MSILKRINEPAFPSGPGDTVVGMTLRDYFAGQIVAACMDDLPTDKEINAYGRDLEPTVSDIIAARAYAIADAMLEYRQRSKS